MKSDKLVDVFKNGNIVIPVYLLKNIENFKLELDEFVFLMYLYNTGYKFAFDPEKISDDLGFSVNKILEFINTLTDKGLISVEALKNEKGFMEDFVTLDGFYNKLKLLVIDDVVEEDTNSKSDSIIFDYIENEFGRTLSAIEYEIINAWLENSMSEDIIKEAVKEAVSNGVSNLKYIDKILYEWSKKGIESVEQVEENRRKRSSVKSDNNDDIDLDIMDWNWFDDDE